MFGFTTSISKSQWSIAIFQKPHSVALWNHGESPWFWYIFRDTKHIYVGHINSYKIYFFFIRCQDTMSIFYVQITSLFINWWSSLVLHKSIINHL
jgi:hypothetical protein